MNSEKGAFFLFFCLFGFFFVFCFFYFLFIFCFVLFFLGGVLSMQCLGVKVSHFQEKVPFLELCKIWCKFLCKSLFGSQIWRKKHAISLFRVHFGSKWNPCFGRGCLHHHIYRLITAYLLLQVNCDKIMHARWDFDASSAQTRRVSALDKHQNWSTSASFGHNSQA